MVEVYRGLRALIESKENERENGREIMRIGDNLLGLTHAGVSFEEFKKLEEKDHPTYKLDDHGYLVIEISPQALKAMSSSSEDFYLTIVVPDIPTKPPVPQRNAEFTEENLAKNPSLAALIMRKQPQYEVQKSCEYQRALDAGEHGRLPWKDIPKGNPAKLTPRKTAMDLKIESLGQKRKAREDKILEDPHSLKKLRAEKEENEQLLNLPHKYYTQLGEEDQPLKVYCPNGCILWAFSDNAKKKLEDMQRKTEEGDKATDQEDGQATDDWLDDLFEEEAKTDEEVDIGKGTEIDEGGITDGVD
ncbi:hypothetical protein PMIN04_009694 [Paraphaeosphaeria minitans]